MRSITKCWICNFVQIVTSALLWIIPKELSWRWIDAAVFVLASIVLVYILYRVVRFEEY